MKCRSSTSNSKGSWPEILSKDIFKRFCTALQVWAIVPRDLKVGSVVEEWKVSTRIAAPAFDQSWFAGKQTEIQADFHDFPPVMSQATTPKLWRIMDNVRSLFWNATSLLSTRFTPLSALRDSENSDTVVLVRRETSSATNRDCSIAHAPSACSEAETSLAYAQ